MIKIVNAVMANVPVKDVKRENPATATVIVTVVKKNSAALNKIELFYKHQASLSMRLDVYKRHSHIVRLFFVS